MCLNWRVKVHILLYESFILIFCRAKQMRSKELRQQEITIRMSLSDTKYKFYMKGQLRQRKDSSEVSVQKKIQVCFINSLDKLANPCQLYI